ncbi:MFS transporter [Pelagibacterium xiamenense]|uniref:MFS transporter n=1 Tax=Pelagibacterium xiamenense TaxID=2901140 RepID=UPI001E607469|nr:MFS transporter [Pelagibacterium xiamenense]MCD7059684.1 MFS transporter [Pelagibacterium xiamenense]
MTRIIPLVLAVALFMENMDATVIATSLPAIAADIGTTPVALKLAFTAYFVALAIFIPISAWMADKFGAKNVFRAAIVVFIIGSIGCAFAGSLQEFVMARFVKGIGGAMMSPLARLILLRTTQRTELVSAMAWLTVPALIGPTLGPPIGGFLTTFLSWHWIFLVNVPIGLAGLVLITRYLPRVESAPLKPMDFPGFFLTAVAFSGTVFGLSLLSMPVLPMWIAFASTGIGVLAAVVYVPYALRIEHPLLDPRLFSEPTYRAAVVGTSLFLVGVGASPFLLPLMLQVGFGYTPFESGMITFVGAFGALLMKFVAKPLYARIGFRTALMSAVLLSAAGSAIKGTFVPETPVVVMMLVIFFVGLLRSTYFTGQNALAFSEISEEQAGAATVIHSVMRPIMTALAVALAGGVLELSSSMRDAPLGVPDFQLAFFIVAGASMLAAIPYALLPRYAGQAVSGHRTAAQRAAALEKTSTQGYEGRSPRF